MDVWYERVGSPRAWGVGEHRTVDKPVPTITHRGISNTGGCEEWYLHWSGEPVSVRSQDKPEYRVPLMTEIAELPANGHSVVSTFSGCGGSCLGLKMAGFRVVWANEFVEAARAVYRANHPDTRLDGRDIRTVSGADILSATGLKRGELDLFEGSPPCASFSTAGKRSQGWGQERSYSDTKQRVDDLFFEYARLLEELQPRMFIAENVSGLVKGVAKGYFLDILRTLESAGYVVKARMLDASWLGVPQSRQRIIFQGLRRDIAERTGLSPRWPEPLKYQYTVRDAIPWITRVSGRTAPGFRELEEPASVPMRAVLASDAHTRYSAQTADERRRFTIDEIKRLCSFPDDFVLTGTYAQQWERLGRAVPPVMMRAIGECVRSVLDDTREDAQ